MPQKTYFLVGLPEEKHWSKLINRQVKDGQFWLMLTLVGESVFSVGKELVQVFTDQDPQTPAELYQLVTKLQQIALDNKVKLSLAAVFLDQKHTLTFFSLNSLVGLKRYQKEPKWLFGQPKNEILALTGKQKLGDLVFLASCDFKDFKPELVNLLIKHHRSKELLTQLQSLLDREKLFASAALTIVDLGSLVQPAKSSQEKEFKSPAANVQVTSKPKTNHWVDNLKQLGQLGLVYLGQLSRYLETLFKKLATLLRLQLAALFAWFKQMRSRKQTFRKLNLDDKTESETESVVDIDELLNPSEAKKDNSLSQPRKIKLQSTYSDKPAKKKFKLHLNFKNKRLLGGVVLALALALVIGVVGAWWFKLNQRKQAISQTLAPYEEKLTQLQATDEANLPQTRDQANQLLENLKVIKTKYPQNSLEAKQIDEQIAAVEAFLASISGKKELQALPVYLDVSKFAADFVISDATTSESKLWLLDKTKKALIIYDDQVKQTHQQALISLDEIKDMASFNQKILLLDNGVYTLEADPTANPTNLIASDDFIAGASLIDSFNEYVYVYNSTKANIYRYGPEFDKEPKPWLKTILGGEYNQVTSWAIDGDIWLATKTGRVNRYQAGKRTAFELKGLESPIDGPVYLTTTTDLDNLYVLVPNQDRVIEFDKKGNFIKEVKNYVLGSATGLVYDSDQNQVLAISGSIVYLVPF